VNLTFSARTYSQRSGAMSDVYVLTFATEAALAFPGSFLFHDCGVSIGLICNHFPATRQAGEDGGFGSTL
jgi:hypothetical protein